MASFTLAVLLGFSMSETFAACMWVGASTDSNTNTWQGFESGGYEGWSEHCGNDPCAGPNNAYIQWEHSYLGSATCYTHTDYYTQDDPCSSEECPPTISTWCDPITYTTISYSEGITCLF